MFVFIYVCMYVSMFVCLCVCMFVFRYAYVYVCLCLGMCVYVRACVRAIRVCVCTYVHLFVCFCVPVLSSRWWDICLCPSAVKSLVGCLFVSQCCQVVGGMSVDKQLRLLKRLPEIVIGTPGRLWQLIQQVSHSTCNSFNR